MTIHTDVDECANDTLHDCFASNHQVCRNVFGSFDCDCEPGYEANSIDNACQGQLVYSTVCGYHGFVVVSCIVLSRASLVASHSMCTAYNNSLLHQLCMHAASIIILFLYSVYLRNNFAIYRCE